MYRLFSGKFFGLCLKYSGSYEQAKDNLQESFIKIFENVFQFNGKGSFEGWMTRIVINTCLREYQTNFIFQEFEDNHIQEPDELSLDEDEIPAEFLIGIIEELPDQYRIVFNLYVFENFAHREIADMLKISVGTSKSNLARARQNLKEKIVTRKHELRRKANGGK